MARALNRDTRRGMLGGVAAGFGRYLDVDPVLVRLAFVVLAFANGLGVVLYLACLVLLPKDGLAPSPAPPPNPLDEAPSAPDVAPAVGGGDDGAPRLFFGYGLILLGTVLLLHNLDWIRWPSWARFEVLWPLILVAMGAGLLRRSLPKARSGTVAPPL
jgi:phage shock protein C